MSAANLSPKEAQRSAGSEAQSWYEATARQRVQWLLDADSFSEFIGPEQREVSPHLPLFDLPQQFDDGIIVGHGSIGGAPVLIAAQEGRFMGGAFGEVHGAKLTGLLRAARDVKSIPVLILFDTGGVRLQEANAGEVAIAEIIRALIEARAAGARIIGLIGGRAGCYGGGGLIEIRIDARGECGGHVGIAGIRIYVTGQNLFIVTKYSGYTPETNQSGMSSTALGIDYGVYPESRIYTVGANVTF